MAPGASWSWRSWLRSAELWRFVPSSMRLPRTSTMVAGCSATPARIATGRTAMKSPASISDTVYFGAPRPIAISSRSSGTDSWHGDAGDQHAQAQAAQIVAYLRSIAAARHSTTAGGSVERGKLVFETKGACLTCHRVDGVGAVSDRI